MRKLRHAVRHNQGRRSFLALALASACNAPPSLKGPRTIVYWEKWTNFEGEAIARVVQTFNEKELARAQAEPHYRPIQVERVTVSRIDEKLLVAIAGGEPPDIAGLTTSLLPAYAQKGALLDLTLPFQHAGIERGDFVPVYWDLCNFEGKTWAAPTAPVSLALHFNQRLFAEAGLNPDRAPVTIEELDAFAERLTRWEVRLPGGGVGIRSGYLNDVPATRKRLLQVGFLPGEPPWWLGHWGGFFGGKLLVGSRVTARAPENLRAYTWTQSYSRNLGVEILRKFRSGFGKFASGQNAFLSGQVAMQLQGVWMHNFIERYAPGMQWSAAPFPFPSDRPDLANHSMVEADVLVIPKGAKHPEEALEFLKYATSQEGLELLCLGQHKFTPRATESHAFQKAHSNPKISLFRQLGLSPTAFAAPQTGVWKEYGREMVAAYDAMAHLARTPQEALRDVELRMQSAVDRERRAWLRREPRP